MKQQPNTNLGYVIFLASVAAIGGFLFGYDTAVISGTIAFVTEYFQLTTLQVGWYVGCALVGSIIGVAGAGVIGDYLGRKKALILSAILFSVSGIGCALSPDFNSLILYRIIGGIGIGMASIISPLYISEISITRYRGRLVSLYQLAITIGFLGAYLVNYLIMQCAPDCATSQIAWVKWLFATDLWRGMLGMESLPALLFFVIIFFVPESPRWLMLKDRYTLAIRIMDKIYPDKEEVMAQVQATKDAIANTVGNEWSLLFKPGIFKAVVIGVLIAILGQFMGVNAVLYYGPTIFEQSGLSSGDSLLYQVFVGLVNTLTTVLALIIIDKVGRKKLVYYGVSGMIVTLLLISLYFAYGNSLGIGSEVLLILFLMYIFCCAVSICAVVWVLLSEMYPIKVRGLAMSIAGFALWIGTYLVGQLTPWMLQNLTPSGTFILFALMCVPYMLIIWRKVPETTGKSLEQIEQFWIK